MTCLKMAQEGIVAAGSRSARQSAAASVPSTRLHAAADISGSQGTRIGVGCTHMNAVAVPCPESAAVLLVLLSLGFLQHPAKAFRLFQKPAIANLHTYSHEAGQRSKIRAIGAHTPGSQRAQLVSRLWILAPGTLRTSH